MSTVRSIRHMPNLNRARSESAQGIGRSGHTSTTIWYHWKGHSLWSTFPVDIQFSDWAVVMRTGPKGQLPEKLHTAHITVCRVPFLK